MQSETSAARVCCAHLLWRLRAVKAQTQLADWHFHSWADLRWEVAAWPMTALDCRGFGALSHDCWKERCAVSRLADCGQARPAFAAELSPWPHLAASVVSVASQKPADCATGSYEDHANSAEAQPEPQ